jgi:hypothetical protein
MMNCLECRRELLIDPRNDIVDLIAHVNICPACSKEREKLLALEDALESSMKVNVPEGLANRVLEISRDEHYINKSGSSPFGGHVWQMAAGLFLAIGLVVYLGLNQYYPIRNAHALEVAVLNHIADERHQLHGSNEINQDTYGNIMTAISTQTTGDIGKVNFASKCQIRKNAGAHLITSGNKGPVTVLVMPGEHIDRNVKISSSRFDGTIYSTVYGSLAVVGEKGEQILPIADRMLQHIVPANS